MVTDIVLQALEEMSMGAKVWEKNRWKLQREKLTRLSPNVRKYIQGQRVLAAWMIREFDEMASPVQLCEYSKTPARLYKMLQAIGFTWDVRRKVWRLHGRLKEPRKYSKASAKIQRALK